jgi:AcrR family transcriptional regulator
VSSADAVRIQPSSPEGSERRAAILAAAARCLAEYGYDRVRLRDISRESRVSIGLIQHYFETRDTLLAEAFTQVSEDLLTQWSEVVRDEPDPWKRIVALVDRLAADPDLRRHCITWTQFCVVASREPALRDGVREIYAVWRRHLADAVREGVASGQFQPALDVDDVLDLLLTHVDGCELSIAAGVGDIDAVRLRELVLRTAALTLGLDPAGVS